MLTSTEYRGVSGCFELSNGTVKLVVAGFFGPRILSYGYDDGENVLGWHPEAKVETAIGTWHPYGGHRLWLAPENMPLSYAPDNEPVDVDDEGNLTVRLKGRVDDAGFRKEMLLSLAASGTEITIDHRLTASEPCEAAAWALTIMAPAGTVVIPNEPAAAYSSESLLPVRSMALWSYTDLTDPRWQFTRDDIRLRVDDSLGDPQKIGVLNQQGWAAYEVGNVRFTKQVEYLDAAYPDQNSNFEFYTAGGFVEVETLSPLRRVASGETIEHREVWSLEMLS
jgi:hypothetical protein